MSYAHWTVSNISFLNFIIFLHHPSYNDERDFYIESSQSNEKTNKLSNSDKNFIFFLSPYKNMTMNYLQ